MQLFVHFEGDALTNVAASFVFCATMIGPPDDSNEIELCIDADGPISPMRVGDRADILSPRLRQFSWPSSANPEILEIVTMNAAEEVTTVLAKAPGTTTLLLRQQKPYRNSLCKIEVK